jgi:hypothetical protein
MDNINNELAKEIATEIIKNLIATINPKKENHGRDFLTGWNSKNYTWWKIKGFTSKGVNYVAYDGRSSSDYKDLMDSSDENRNCFYGKIEKILYHYKESDKNTNFHSGMKICVFLTIEGQNDGVIIVSGLPTLFSRGLLLCLLRGEGVDGYIKIKPSPGTTNPENVFCEVYSEEAGRIEYSDEEWKNGEGNDYLLLELANSGKFNVEKVDKLMEDMNKIPVSSHKYLGKKDTPVAVNLDDLIQKSDELIAQLGWSVEDSRDYLIEHYNKKTRRTLTDKEFSDFILSLQTLVYG